MSARRTLVDDATGRIVYVPGVVADAEHTAWFRVLARTISWQHESRPMYDRVVDGPRLVAWFHLDGTEPQTISAAHAAIAAVAGERFTSAALNLYRGRSDSVAMHSDRNEGLAIGSSIALLSLGDTRVMRLQSLERPPRATAIALEAGSVLLMAGAAQEHWKHGVPKTRDAVGPRISVVFRKRARGAGDSDSELYGRNASPPGLVTALL